MQEHISIPACFSSPIEKLSDDPSAITRSGQNVFMSVYRTKIAGQCRLITVTWCKNMLLHGLSVSVEGGGEGQHTCKVELKPWYFWKKQGSKSFSVAGNKQVHVFWDLKAAKFSNGETEPGSDNYVAIACDGEVVLLLGNLKKEAYRKTRCRPALIDPILVSRKEHIFGKRKFVTRVRFHEKGSFHEICIECKNNKSGGGSNNSHSNNKVADPEMEIHVDGNLLVHVKNLQWKFRGNNSIHLNRSRIEVYWDVHDWLFCPGLRHASFVFKPVLGAAFSSSCGACSSPSPPLVSSSSMSSSPSSMENNDGCGGASSDFCLFLYAWRVE